MSRYYRENPDEPIRHDWTEGGKRRPEPEPTREEIVRCSAVMGGITERWEYAAAVDRYKETGTVEAHEAMLATYARLNAAVSAEMPPIDPSSATESA